MTTADGTDDREIRYRAAADRFEIPMLIASLLVIPIVILPLAEDLSSSAERGLFWVSVGVWLAFVAEFLALLYLAPNKTAMVRERRFELLLIVVPFLQPLRLGYLLARLAGAGTALRRAVGALRRLIGRPGFAPVLGIVGALIVAGGTFVTIAEHEQPTSTIGSWGDGLWWAFVTCTTVGYGDEFPVTASGRWIAVVLMLTGITGLSALTANVAAYFVSTDTENEDADLRDRLERIEGQLHTLLERSAVSEQGSTE